MHPNHREVAMKSRKTSKSGGRARKGKASAKRKKKAGKAVAKKKTAKTPAKRKPKASPRKPKKVSKAAGGKTLEVTDIQVLPVNRMLEDGEELLAEFAVTFNRLLNIRGFAIVRAARDSQPDFQAFISPPMGVNAEGDAFEVIRFLDAEDPDQSPWWNRLTDKIAAAFASEFGLVRND
jgi:hypothetical protein